MSTSHSRSSTNLTSPQELKFPQDTLVFRRIPLEMLQVGLTLSHAVYGEEDVKLIGADVPIDEVMLHRLMVRGIESVLVEEADYEKLISASMGDTSNGFTCKKCETALPLKEAKANQVAMEWICVNCHSKYHGFIDINASGQLVDNIRLAKFPIQKSNLLHPDETVAKAVNSLVSKRYTGPERRGSPRMAVTIPVAAVSVDEHYCPVGAPFVLTTRNISTSGIALIHNERIHPKFLIVELPGKDSGSSLQLVVEVLRCRPLGSVHEVAGKFVMTAAD